MCSITLFYNTPSCYIAGYIRANQWIGVWLSPRKRSLINPNVLHAANLKRQSSIPTFEKESFDCRDSYGRFCLRNRIRQVSIQQLTDLILMETFHTSIHKISDIRQMFTLQERPWNLIVDFINWRCEIKFAKQAYGSVNIWKWRSVPVSHIHICHCPNAWTFLGIKSVSANFP